MLQLKVLLLGVFRSGVLLPGVLRPGVPWLELLRTGLLSQSSKIPKG